MKRALIFFLPFLLFSQLSFRDQQNQYPRVRQARNNRIAQIDSFFHEKDIPYPPSKIIIIAYKQERILQLWAQAEAKDGFQLVKSYSFTAFSGNLGPKRQRGDLQIPEGFYHINHFNPYSNFHLSMKISYPNESDRILGVSGNLGNEIRIHGSSVTIGCIPIGNEAIEELYVICVDVKTQGQTNIPVYAFPCGMHRANMEFLKSLAAGDSSLITFWYNLKQGYDIFLSNHEELFFTVDNKGRYIFSNELPGSQYLWHDDYTSENTLINRIAVPDGYTRSGCTRHSFTQWLRYLPSKPGNPPVYLYNNEEKSYQNGHALVMDIDIGEQDLQQCADAIMRLYAEYLFSQGKPDDIEFMLTNNDNINYRTWVNGFRPVVRNNVVIWHQTAARDSSYESFRRYLDFIFTYAGTHSLSQQLQPVASIDSMQVGDVFIQGGFPGHAVMVVDMAINEQTREKIFLLAQSYMPAQDIHILENLNEPEQSPWYFLHFGDSLYTPEWTFSKDNLKRF